MGAAAHPRYPVGIILHPAQGHKTVIMEESKNYTLQLRQDAAFSRAAEREALLNHLLRIPGLEAVEADLYVFGDEDEHGRMELELFVRRDGERVAAAEVTDAEHARCDELEVRIPRPHVHAHGPRVFALVFMVAEWAKWEVFDPQIESVLQKEAVLSGLVAMRQAQRDAEAKVEAPAPTPVDYESVTKTPPPEKKRRRPWFKRG